MTRVNSVSLHNYSEFLFFGKKDLTDAEQEICTLRQEKLTLINAFTASQGN